MQRRLCLALAMAFLGWGLSLPCRARGGEQAEIGSALADSVREELRIDRFSIVSLELPLETRPTTFSLSVERSGQRREYHLERRSIRGPDFRLLVQRAAGQSRSLAPRPAGTYRGNRKGYPSERVAASLLPAGLRATFVNTTGEAWSVVPLRHFDPRADREAHIVYEHGDERPFRCGTVERTGMGGDDAPEATQGGVRAKGPAPDCTVTVADVAFDSDYEFFIEDCEGDPGSCLEIVEAGLNVTNLIYERDVKITHRLSTVMVRADPDADFYGQFPDASDFGAMLTAFRQEWNDNMQDVPYDIAYLLTGKSRPEYGGLAFVGVVCSSSRYGMGIGGWGYEGIFRHEVGHNWGAGHSCGLERRYIMCGNSISAISAFNIAVMSSHRESRSCLEETPYESQPAEPFARLDRVVLSPGHGPVQIDVVRGDTDLNCDRLGLGGFDSRSARGATILSVDSLDSQAPDALVYMPRPGTRGADYLRYSVIDGTGFEASGVVLVEITPGDLVAYLPMDETSGNEAADASGHDLGGELRGDLSFDGRAVPGRHGGAVSFPGLDGEYISLGDDPAFDLRRGLTVAAWFRVDGFGGEGESIVAKGSSAWRLERDGRRSALKFTCSGVAVAGSDEGTVSGSVAVNDGEWHHAAGVYDGREIALYIDGQLDSSAPASGLISTNSSSVRIGDDGWNGPIDEVRIYNYGLAAGEILALHEDARIERPEPADGATGVVVGAELRWLPAPSATAHDVYFGTDFTAVAAADETSPEYRGRRAAPLDRPDLEPGTTYYWRVDEVEAGSPRRGSLRRFSTAFASTDFDEPPPGASSFSPGAGEAELGFRSTWSPTDGENPFVGVVETSTTPTTPVLSHRSVQATTTFDSVDLSDRGPTAIQVLLQARSTGYEEEDGLEVFVTNGTERVDLLVLEGGAALTQRAGTGYAGLGAVVPADWSEARLVLSTSSDSSRGSERYDLDRVSFSCHEAHEVLAGTRFEEPDVGASSHAAAAGRGELGFRTTSSSTGGAQPLVAVVEAGSDFPVRFLTHRSVRATTTFDAVDLEGWAGVRAMVVVRIRSTGYESEDRLDIFLTDGTERVDLLAVSGASGLEELADDRYLGLEAEVPAGWREATLVFASASNSSAGSEQYDLRAVEFLGRPDGASCEAVSAGRTAFRRGDDNADGQIDLSDPVSSLGFQFLGGEDPPCLDALDFDDSGLIEVTDAILNLSYQFLGGDPPALPGALRCGPDLSPDGGAPGEDLGCRSYPEIHCR